MGLPAYRLLEPDEPPAFLELRRQGRSNFVIAVDHAGRRIPRRLGCLGLSAAQLLRHIAWDIGALSIAQLVSSALDAPLIAQNYSRLVIDCNRNPAAATSIPQQSETVEIPGNLGLDELERDARRSEIFEPYHGQLRALLDERQAAGRQTILVAQHTMTDVFAGSRRTMQAAVLYNRDRRFASLVLEALRQEPQLQIAENVPYGVSEQNDFTIPRHAEARGLPYVAIEVRQDLLADQSGQSEWAGRIAEALLAAERGLQRRNL